jgi:sugar/nucleoside kinase (ribokinase family)
MTFSPMLAREMTPVIIIGELNVDLIMSGVSRWPALGTEVSVDGFTMTLGSSSAICAVGLARLGRPVSFIGLVGEDAWGAYCVHVLRSAGVDVSRVMRDSTVQTGVTVSLTSPAGRALVTYPGATAALTAAQLPETLFSQLESKSKRETKRERARASELESESKHKCSPGHLHVSSFFLQSGMRESWGSIVTRAHDAGWTVSLDSGCDPDNVWDADLRALVSQVDVFLPNDVELAGITGCPDPEAALRVLDNGRTRIVAKLGAAGCMTLVGGRPLHVAPPPVVAVDTTGAGDSFNAGFLHAWLDARPLDECLRCAVACGALSTRAPGGTTAQPASHELTRCLEARW